jgi:hypothetical protein
LRCGAAPAYRDLGGRELFEKLPDPTFRHWIVMTSILDIVIGLLLSIAI